MKFTIKKPPVGASNVILAFDFNQTFFYFCDW